MDGREVDGAALEAGTEAQVSLYPAATAGPAALTSQPVQPHHSCTAYKILMDEGTIKEQNHECRPYWCLIEFIDWR
jgi:hypothetical protein